MKRIIPCLLLVLGGCATKPAAVEPAKTAAVEEKQYTRVDPATAGAVTGKITISPEAAAKAKKMKPVNMDEDPQCAKLHPKGLVDDALQIDASTKTVANVFVHIKQGLEGKNFLPPVEAITVAQKGCWFAPRVVGIQVGQTFRVVNDDPVTHNIHPLPQLNREWNQSQDAGSEALTRKFTKPEVMVRVKCNIHPWMHGWVGVVDGPYFSVTGANGAFEIKNLPPGSYVVEAWHEELGTKQASVTIGPSGKPELNITF